ncbi:MAG: AbrB/MazE/SpoVT family DNA-binding domain-containing protein [Acidobacteriaceae bacterium]|nr:AbrB/MazE/SpoVT family DNA-binding domain-containing protein [Acidobacteriaceae bacterium]MBV9764590.1 AbrB/MazE/SpoVT family DNA-binding domain-containing protein [Acidobacteriaceae bacterium]
MALAKETAVAKWGNAPAIRIPKSIMQKANLHEGDAVTFEVDAPGVIVVRATRALPTLDELLARVTPANRHAETNWGPPKGNEDW